MSYSKEARQYAKANGLALFSIEVETSGDGVTGRYATDGPADCALARSLWFFCNAVLQGGKPEKEFSKHFKDGKPIDSRRNKDGAE